MEWFLGWFLGYKMSEDRVSLFGENRKLKKDGIFGEAGQGILKVGRVVGAGILVGMGFHAFQDSADGY